jgi:hypothetical protein
MEGPWWGGGDVCAVISGRPAAPLWSSLPRECVLARLVTEYVCVVVCACVRAGVCRWVEGFDFIQQLPPSSESDVRIEVCRCMTITKSKRDVEMCKQGDKGDCMYVILQGEVDIYEELGADGRKHLTTMGEGTSFGALCVCWSRCPGRPPPPLWRGRVRCQETEQAN